MVRSGSAIGKVRRFFSNFNPLVLRFKIADELKNIGANLVEIAALKSDLVLTDIISDMPVILRERVMTHSFVRVEDVIGREDDKYSIFNMLIQSIDGENMLIIPIFGMGGLGKTTLPKFMYEEMLLKTSHLSSVHICPKQHTQLFI